MKEQLFIFSLMFILLFFLFITTNIFAKGVVIMYILLGLTYTIIKIVKNDLPLIGNNKLETTAYMFAALINVINWVFLINQR